MEQVTSLLAEKGNATKLMNRQEYNNKMEELLKSGTYRIMKRDPLAVQDAKIDRVLREYVKKIETSEELYNWLRNSGCQPPECMGT